VPRHATTNRDEQSPDDLTAAPGGRRTPGPGGMHVSYHPGAPVVRRWRTWYVSTKLKFIIACVAAACWVGVSAWISLAWIGDLADHVTIVPAVVLVSLLAFVPGFLVAFLTAGALLDSQPALVRAHPTAPLTILIAARNEAASISDTLRSLAAQDYAGEISVLLVDNGSTDATAVLAEQAGLATGMALTVMQESTSGKSHALNAGLARVNTSLVITLDADTLLHMSAIRLLVARLQASPPDVVAVAGDVMVRNSRNGLLSRMQAWDYMLGIAAIKRIQGLFQGTLVAQGAFSLYRTEDVRAVGAWPDAIGEDIVLTWQLMRRGRIYYEPLAVAFTSAPERLRGLVRQRSRWARGMLEGISAVPPWRQPRGMARALTGIDLAIPLLDLAYVFVWLPGLVLACFGCFWFVGPMTVAVLPMTVLVYGLLLHFQRRRVLEPLGLVHRRNGWAFVIFLVFYQALMSATSVYGYAQEVFRRKRSWK
jgi:biofilm PGA synthesis N-glycosyltransferase PgaC